MSHAAQPLLTSTRCFPCVISNIALACRITLDRRFAYFPHIRMSAQIVHMQLPKFPRHDKITLTHASILPCIVHNANLVLTVASEHWWQPHRQFSRHDASHFDSSRPISFTLTSCHASLLLTFSHVPWIVAHDHEAQPTRQSCRHDASLFGTSRPDSYTLTSCHASLLLVFSPA